MVMQLRDYQNGAIQSTRTALRRGIKKPLIVAPTASGKSLIIAGIIKAAIEKNSNIRILILCFQGEILEQNENILLKVYPEADTGIYCAGLGRKEPNANIVFASRDSLGRNPMACGDFDIIIVDEAHLISTNPETYYGKIFEALEPKWIIGLTGTPWRLDNGKIWEAKGFFDELAYNIPLNLLVERGFLSKYRFPDNIETIIDASDVPRSSTGDFNIEALTKVSSTEEIVAKCIDKWELIAKIDPRRCSIFFCCSLAHAEVVTNELKRRDVNVAYLDGKTKKAERRQILIDCRAGKYESIVNVGVLTTGVDIPIIDCVVMLRATRSAALWVQMNGRGLRIYPDKADCIMIDLTDNFERFDSLETPLAPKGKDDKPPKGCSQCGAMRRPKEPNCWQCGWEFKMNEEMIKICPTCDYVCHTATKVCPYCQHIFITHSVDFHTDNAQKTGWFLVDSYTWEYSATQKGEPCVILDIKLHGMTGRIKQWLLYERDWAKWARNQIAELEVKVIELVRIDDRTKDFPKVQNILYKEGEPVEAIGERDVKDDAFFDIRSRHRAN